MKLNFSQPLLVGCIALLSLQGQSAAASGTDLLTGGEDPAVKKKAVFAKTKSSRNNHAVRIYPDAVRRVMHVVAKNNDGKQIDFFVFDLDGTLKQHYKMAAGEHERLTSLERGKYMYNVFAGDEETASGQFEIR
jgi:hypothetical protein